MTAQPIPVNVPAGHVVRVQVFKHTYVSPIMSPADARLLADQLHAEADRIGGGYGFLPGYFATADGGLIRLRGRSITTIEAGPPPARREQPAPPVHVHLHVDGAAVADEVTEATVGLIPSPKALAELAKRR